MVLHPSGHLYYLVSPRALFWGQFCSFSLKTICLRLNHQMSSYVPYRHIESSADHDKGLCNNYQEGRGGLKT